MSVDRLSEVGKGRCHGHRREGPRGGGHHGGVHHGCGHHGYGHHGGVDLTLCDNENGAHEHADLLNLYFCVENWINDKEDDKEY